MKHPIAVVVGIGMALVAATIPASAQSARVDASVHSPDAELRITFVLLQTLSDKSGSDESDTRPSRQAAS